MKLRKNTSKKLNLDQIWKVYNLLKPAVENREPEKVILDEIFKIIELSSPENLLECMRIMYDNRVRFESPMEFNILFMDGLNRNKFFDFCDFIRGLNDLTK